MLSTLSMKALSISIIDFKIHGLIIPIFLLYLTLVLMLAQFPQAVFFAFQYDLQFFFVVRHDVPSIGNCSKWVYGNAVVRYGGEGSSL